MSCVMLFVNILNKYTRNNIGQSTTIVLDSAHSVHISQVIPISYCVCFSQNLANYQPAVTKKFLPKLCQVKCIQASCIVMAGI